MKGPAAITQISDIDKKIYGAWGHELCCEKAYGPCETTTRIKDNVTTKVGSNWSKTVMVERGISTMCSAMYAGSMVERSCSHMANEGVGSLNRVELSEACAERGMRATGLSQRELATQRLRVARVAADSARAATSSASA